MNISLPKMLRRPYKAAATAAQPAGGRVGVAAGTTPRAAASWHLQGHILGREAGKACAQSAGLPSVPGAVTTHAPCPVRLQSPPPQLPSLGPSRASLGQPHSEVLSWSRVGLV